MITRSFRAYPFLVLLLAVFCIPVLCNAEEADIMGAGASFPNPLYQQWAQDYYESKGIRVFYDSIGSGGGQKAIKEKRVLFGGSDAPMSSSQLEKFGLLQFPMVVGAIVPVVNIPGLESGSLKLDAEVLAKIFLSEITRWRDPAILALQDPDVSEALPDIPIDLVVRDDSSGSTWVFTRYLYTASKTWKASGIEFGKKPEWKSDHRGPQNDGVADLVSATAGSIGYVEFAYVEKYDLDVVKLLNRSGAAVLPGVDSFNASANFADWQHAPSNFEINMINLSGEDAWPILAVTYILIHERQIDEKAILKLLDFLNYCYLEAAETAEDLNYIPLPEAAVAMIQEKIWQRIHVDGVPVWKQD